LQPQRKLPPRRGGGYCNKSKIKEAARQQPARQKRNLPA
jgi:hypothetical protein